MQSELMALAERVQALPAKGCRLTEIEVARLVLGRAIGVAKYTISLDAAMTLVPEGYAVGFKRAPCQRSHAMLATIGEDHNASGATPALALTAAALLALAEQVQQ